MPDPPVPAPPDAAAAADATLRWIRAETASRVIIPANRPSSATARPSMPDPCRVFRASHSASAGARNGACGGTAITSSARVAADLRRPRRCSRFLPMTPITRSPPTTGTAETASAPANRSANVSTVRCGATRGPSACIDSPTVVPRSRISRSRRRSSVLAAVAISHPRQIRRSPGVRRSPSAIAMPMPTMTQPSARPRRAVCRPARSRSPLRAQASARTARPPSSGSPGTRLTSPRARFRPPTSTSPPTTAPGPEPLTSSTRAAGRMTAASTSDRPGPASAIASSSPGRPAWIESGASPPTNPRTMVDEATPRRRPTSAWASSWATTEATTPSATREPTTQWSGTGMPGDVMAACSAPTMVTMAASPAQTSEILISMPNSRAIGTPPAFTARSSRRAGRRTRRARPTGR